MSRADTMLDVHQPTLSPESELIAREEHLAAARERDVAARIAARTAMSAHEARAREERALDDAIGEQLAADARVAANEQRRLAEARREVAADDFEAKYQRWLASDVPEARRSPDWSPERNVSAADRAEPAVVYVPSAEPDVRVEITEAPRRRGRIDVERVRELAAAGMTITEIAAELGCWRESVWKVGKRHGIAIRRTSLAESGRLGAAVRHAAQASQETT